MTSFTHTNSVHAKAKADSFTEIEFFDLCRALGSKVNEIERGLKRARLKGLLELASNLEKSLNNWIRLLNKTKAFTENTDVA